MSPEVKGIFLGTAAALGVLGLAFGLSPLLQTKEEGLPLKRGAAPVATTASLTGEAKQGHELFDRNCAHCHGEDARGDEGPNLHNLAKSDARIAAILKGGIKGEMPSFAKKFTDADVQALTSFLRTLKD
jgi:mono/diheme cytochrome c family protein